MLRSKYLVRLGSIAMQAGFANCLRFSFARDKLEKSRKLRDTVNDDEILRFLRFSNLNPGNGREIGRSELEKSLPQ